MPAKAQRNDSRAVAQAAKAVDRDDVVALLQLELGKRLAEAKRKAERQRQFSAAPSPTPSASQRAAAVPFPTSSSARSRRSPRSARYDVRKVTVTGRGRWPRYGTHRYEKAEFVRNKVRTNEEANKLTHVYTLVGAYYNGNDRLTLHDLEIMVEKRLITLEE